MYRFNLSEDTLGGIGIDDIINKNLEIFLSDALQVINSAHSTVLSLNSESLESTDSGIHTGTVHGVTDGTGIGEERKVHTTADVIVEDRVGIGIDVVLKVTGHNIGNLNKLIS
eukprot:634186_1